MCPVFLWYLCRREISYCKYKCSSLKKKSTSISIEETMTGTCLEVSLTTLLSEKRLSTFDSNILTVQTVNKVVTRMGVFLHTMPYMQYLRS